MMYTFNMNILINMRIYKQTDRNGMEIMATANSNGVYLPYSDSVVFSFFLVCFLFTFVASLVVVK